MTKSSIQKKKASKENGVTMICPSCLTRYSYREDEVAGHVVLCGTCHAPLVREDRNRHRFRCLRCTGRMITPEGVWCTRFGRYPTPEEASCCTEFEARARKRRRARRSA